MLLFIYFDFDHAYMNHPRPRRYFNDTDFNFFFNNIETTLKFRCLFFFDFDRAQSAAPINI